MHINKTMVTDVLKGELGFGGFVVTDYNGCFQVGPSNARDGIAACLNAGADMFMIFGGDSGSPPPIGSGTTVPEHHPLAGRHRQRADGAARRRRSPHPRGQVRDGPVRQRRGDRSRPRRAGSGRRSTGCWRGSAVQKSLVVLKNDGNVLPLSKSAKVALAGSSAENSGNQCGGWTITWQGTTGDGVPGATSVRDGDGGGGGRGERGLFGERQQHRRRRPSASR